MKLRELLEAGQAAQDKEHAEAEVLKRGNLRGGSTGVIGSDGKIYGECHRVALARMLGADKEHEANRAIMFDAGNRNEDSWAMKLISAGADIRREEEIPVVMEISGKKVTGRPDIVVGATVDGNFAPEFGIELKGIYSASSALRVEIEGVPDGKHLAQAAFYSMALDVPYVLAYTNPSVIDVPFWAKKLTSLRKIQPFYRLFELRWTDDTLEYKDEMKTEWITTKYTKQGIKDYFALVAEMEANRDLGPRPTGGYADGTPLPWDRCQYCPLQKTCDKHESDYTEWLKDLKDNG